LNLSAVLLSGVTVPMRSAMTTNSGSRHGLEVGSGATSDGRAAFMAATPTYDTT